MATSFQYSAFQLNAFQIDALVPTDCDQDYVVAGYMDAGYVCGVVQPTGGGIGHGGFRRKKRKVYIEREDGKVLLFDNANDAAAFVAAEKAILKAQEESKPVRAIRKAVKRLEKVEKETEPEVVDLSAVQAYLEAQQAKVKAEELLIRQQFDTLVAIQIHLNAWMAEEDDIEVLLLGVM